MKMNPANSLSNIRCWLVVLAANVLLIASSVAQEKIPVIPANGFFEEAKKLASRCEENCNGAHPLVTEIEKAYEEENISRIEPKLIGPAYSKVSQAFRDAIELKDLKEPAGIDYYFRAQHQRKMLLNAANDLRSFERGRKWIQLGEKAFRNHTRKRIAAIEKATGLLQKGKVAEADETYDDLLNVVDAYYPWLNVGSRRTLVVEAEGMSKDLETAVGQMRIAQAAESLSEALTENNPNIDKVLQVAESAVNSIKSSGMAKLAGAELDGPDAIKKLVEFWKKSQTNCVRSMAIARLGAGLKLSVEPKDLIGTRVPAEKYETALSGLSQNMSELLVELVKADMARPGASSDKAKYVRYLNTLGDLKSIIPDSFIKRCESELSVSGDLKTAIRNYTVVTDDILLWRSRAAESKARAEGDFLDISSVVPLNDLDKISPNLKMGMGKAIQQLDKGMIGKNASAENWNPINAKASFSKFNSNSWATAIGEVDLAPEIASLQRDLFVNPDNPPLSLKAATALQSAKQMKVSKLGGTISGIQVEAVGSRFATLSPQMGALLPINRVPDMGAKSQLDASLLRFNLDPLWVQHEYFFKKFQ